MREAKSEPLGKHSLGDALAAGFELVVNWAEHKKVWSVAYSPDGSTLASESTDRTIKLWDVASGRVRRTLSGHRERVMFIAFAPEGSTLASGSLDGTIKFWDLASGMSLRTFSEYEDYVRSVVFLPDGSTLAATCAETAIRLWDVMSGRELKTPDEDWSRSIVFPPSAKRLTRRNLSHEEFLRGLEEAHVHRLHRHTPTADLAEKLKQRLDENGQFNTCLSFSPDGTTLALGSDENTITLRDLETGRVLQQLWGHENDVTSLAFSPDGWFLASASYDKTIILWWVCDGTIAARFIAKGPLGSITLDGKGLPIAVSGNEEANYHFVKNGEVVGVSEMRAMGYDLPTPDATAGADRLSRKSRSPA